MKASKFSKTKCNRYRELIALCMTNENAAVTAFGISRACYYIWKSENSTLSEKQKIDFVRAEEGGLADINTRLGLYILKGAENNGQFAMTVLERLESKTFGQSPKVIGDKDNPLTVNHTFTDDQLKRIITKQSEGVDRGDNKEGGN